MIEVHYRSARRRPGPGTSSIPRAEAGVAVQAPSSYIGLSGMSTPYEYSAKFDVWRARLRSCIRFVIEWDDDHVTFHHLPISP